MSWFRKIVVSVAVAAVAFGCGSREVQVEVQQDLAPEQRQAMDQMQQQMLQQQEMMLRQVGALPQNGQQAPTQ